MIILMSSLRHSATNWSTVGILHWEKLADRGCLVARSRDASWAREKLSMFPVPVVTLFTVWSWKATACWSEVKLTSNSIHLAPFLAASLMASRLFSGASRQAAL